MLNLLRFNSKQSWPTKACEYSTGIYGWYNDPSKCVWVHAQLKASRKNDEEKSEECRLETETVENSFHPTYFSKLKVKDLNRLEGERSGDTKEDM